MNPITAQFVFNSSESPNQFISTLYGNLNNTTDPFKGLMPAASVAEDTSGSLYIFGQAGFNSDIVPFQGVYKISTQGAFQWQRAIGVTAPIYETIGCYDGTVDISGFPYFCGNLYFTNASGTLGSIATLVKYNSNGSLVFQYSMRDTTFTGGLSPEMSYKAITVDSNNNIFAAGTHIMVPDYENRGILIKYNSGGVVQWQRAIRGTNPATGMYAYIVNNAIKTDVSGDVYVGGEYINSSGGYIGALTKYNSTGTIQWQRSLLTSANGANAANNIGVGSLEVDSQRNLYGILIDRQNDLLTQNVFHVFKYDTNGNLVWRKKATLNEPDQDPTYPPYIDFGRIKLIDNENSIVVGGFYRYYDITFNYRRSKAFIIKYSTLNGALQYQRFFTNSYCDDSFTSSDIQLKDINVTRNSNLMNVLFAVYKYTEGAYPASHVVSLKTNGGNLGTWTLPYSDTNSNPATFTMTTGNIVTDATGTFTSSTITLTGVTPTYTTGTTTMTTGSSSGTPNLIMI